MPKLLAVLLTTATLAVGLAACGGSSSTSTASSSASTSTTSAAAAPASSASSHLSLAAAPSGMLMFTKTSLTAKAGKVTISFTNMAPEKHNLTIQKGTSGPVIAATPTFSGATKTLTVTLKPGTYTYYCSVPGHRMAGMQGTLTIT